MKKNILLLLVLLFPLFIGCEPEGDNEPEPEPEVENLHIPDEHFKNALLNEDVVDTNYDGVGDTDADVDNDGEIQRTEAEAVQRLLLHFDYRTIDRYVDLSGIEYFINVTSLTVTGEGGIYDINKPDPELLTYDFTALKKLEFLQVNHLASNYFEIFDLRGLNNLVELDLSHNRPTWYGDEEDYKEPYNFIEVKMLGLNRLKKMSFLNSFLYVDFCEVPALEILDMWYLEGGEPETFDFHCLTKLEWLNISENHIDNLILKNSSVLTTLLVRDIGSAPYSYLPHVEYICIDDVQEEWDQISSLIDENSVVTTDCSL